ncbi:hypothetical protein B0J13DRAFT_567930 [Dactylonectria estremocensis]|uniref:Protein kinase domain-containing protein n=1 Tax=Dactylonectria estremocensis TaxID=1079267 RepID=A0A9P9IFX0_9HYPO|nr:hypothetical protein B0J13DRAFT_567930 [Dactylonectria estremocensis]
MEYYTTASTAIRDIYAVTVFICTVINDMKEYKEELSDTQKQIDYEFCFVETFKYLFFDGDGAPQWYAGLPKNLARSVHDVLIELQNSLAKYKVIAIQHGMDVSWGELVLESMASKEPTDSQHVAVVVAVEKETVATGQDNAPVEKSKRIARAQDKIKSRILEVKTKFEWALFQKAQIRDLLKQYQGYTKKLNRVMTLILLAEGRLGAWTRGNLNINSKMLHDLGLAKIAARQTRAESEPPSDFNASGGTFTPDSDLKRTQTTYQVGEYETDGFNTNSFRVILERHDLAIYDENKTKEEKQAMRLKLVRSLAWMLRETDPSTVSHEKVKDGATPMYILGCLGYHQEDKSFSLFYELPDKAVSKPETLYDLMKDSKSKPALGDRYFLAWALASTLFNIHSSGWVHKNISSKSILVFRQGGRLVPYIAGWTVARPQTKEYRDMSKVEDRMEEDKAVDAKDIEKFKATLEPELYQHPKRYRTAEENFKNEHDIYSVGVVLLEIGLWSIMLRVLERGINQVAKKEKYPSSTEVEGAVYKETQKLKLSQQMGSEYAKLVQACLRNEFGVRVDNKKSTDLTGQFFEIVVEKLRLGTMF